MPLLGDSMFLPPPFLLVFVVGLTALFVYVWWTIFDKAGFGGPLGLLMIVPGVNLIMLVYLAVTEWPVHRELRELRQRIER